VVDVIGTFQKIAEGQPFAILKMDGMKNSENLGFYLVYTRQSKRRAFKI